MTMTRFRRAVVERAGNAARSLNRRTNSSVAEKSGWITCRAALLAGQLGLHDAAPQLIPLLKNYNPLIRISAIQALGLLRFWPPSTRSRRFRTDKDPAVRLAAVEALAACRQPTVAADFTPLLQDQDAVVRAHALAAAAAMSTAVPELVKALGDENVGVRAVAAAALGNYGDAACQPVTALLDDKSPETRIAAIQAAGRHASRGIRAAAGRLACRCRPAHQ